MATLSIPLDAELTKFVEDTTVETGLTKAGVVRQALKRYADEQAIDALLQSQKEISAGKVLRGDLNDILLGD